MRESVICRESLVVIIRLFNYNFCGVMLCIVSYSYKFIISIIQMILVLIAHFIMIEKLSLDYCNRIG